jgi:uncharacterized repeat protein (TIGR01451 family)
MSYNQMEFFAGLTGDMYRRSFSNLLGMLIAAGCPSLTSAQAMSNPVAIKAIAEVESGGRLQPADRVVSGDTVIYTLQVRNTGTSTLPPPTVTYPLPAHMAYVADSAVGPGTEVSYSVDGGRSFDKPENLTIENASGESRPALDADYTDIRWQLKNPLKGHSVAFVRFRAIVK